MSTTSGWVVKLELRTPDEFQELHPVRDSNPMTPETMDSAPRAQPPFTFSLLLLLLLTALVASLLAVWKVNQMVEEVPVRIANPKAIEVGMPRGQVIRLMAGIRKEGTGWQGEYIEFGSGELEISPARSTVVYFRDGRVTKVLHDQKPSPAPKRPPPYVGK